MSERVDVLTRDQAERAADIVSEECGARYQGSDVWDRRDREAFVRYFVEPGFHEWRFIGALGFGGKLYLNCGRLRVSCYSEDRTPQRDAMIERANERLAVVLR